MTAVDLAALQDRGGALWRSAFYLPSLVYGAAVAGRSGAYRRGFLETVRMPVPVFCVGNITTGGTGKTPATIWLANRLTGAGRRTAIITRGFGRRNPHAVRLISDGKKILADAREAGDEPRLLAERCPGAAVVVGADRAAAARRALEETGADAVVMDDGYQHHRLHRDMNLLCLDASEAVPGNGALLPAGRLREPLEAMARAHVVFLTKANLVSAERVGGLRRSLAEDFPGLPLVAVDYRLSFWDPAARAAVSPATLFGREVVALSGLARPQSFEEALTKEGMKVSPARFPDHHFFSVMEQERVRRDAGERPIVVTEKDRVRLREDFPCVVARLEWVPEDGPWTKKIDSVISSNT